MRGTDGSWGGRWGRSWGLGAAGLVALALGACTADANGDAAETGSSGPDAPTTSASGAATTATDPTGAAASTGDPNETDGPTTQVTFHRDIRPLIERHCTTCHTPGSIAPFPLQTYAEVSELREAIVTTTQEGTMPPWGMDGDCGDFESDPSLSEAQIDLIAMWANSGAPEGSPDDFVAPDPIVLPELSRTDLTLQVPEAYMPTQTPDEYRCFLMEWPETETKYVTGLQFDPDNETIAHHAIAYVVAPEEVETYQALDDEDPGLGYTCFGGPNTGDALDFITSRWLGAWAPGARVGDLPEGTGLRIEPGSRIVLQMHYNTLAANGMPDQSAMHYKLETQVQREAVMLPWADPGWLSGTMHIPAGTDDTVHGFALDPTTIMGFLSGGIIADGVPLELFSTMHHMHKRGSSGQQTLLRADGSSECLLAVPRYDYDWQHDFRRAKSVVIHPGDELEVRCQWDNSANDQSVNWGDGTDDEMCLGIHYVAAAQ